MSKGTLSKVALPAVVAAAGAALGLLFTRSPKRLREAIPELPRGARDLIGDVKQRGEASMPPTGGNGSSSSDFDEFEARRRERKERRERRRQRATT